MSRRTVPSTSFAGAVAVARRTYTRFCPALPMARHGGGCRRAGSARLPRRQRKAIALRHLADLSPPTVAASHGISVNSVKRHLQRGMATLRDDLSDEED